MKVVALLAVEMLGTLREYLSYAGSAVIEQECMKADASTQMMYPVRRLAMTRCHELHHLIAHG
jgi:hypothetical protein